METYNDKRLEKAYDHIMSGELYEAIELFEEYLERHPNNIVLLMEEANLYYILGEMTKCIATYKKVMEIKPDNIFALYRIGVTYYRSTNFTAATEVFNKIIASRQTSSNDLHLAWLIVLSYWKRRPKH